MPSKDSDARCKNLEKQMLQYEKKIGDLEANAKKQENQINGLTNKMLNNKETIQRLLNIISGLERNIIFQQCITNVASRVGEELRWQLDTLKQHKEERIILKGAIIRDGETPESLQKFVQETINDIERKSENTGKIKMVNSHITGRIRGGIHQDVVVTLKTRDMKHTLYKNRKHLQHRMNRVATEKHNPNSRTFQDFPGHFSCFSRTFACFIPGLFTKIKNLD